MASFDPHELAPGVVRAYLSSKGWYCVEDGPRTAEWISDDRAAAVRLPKGDRIDRSWYLLLEAAIEEIGRSEGASPRSVIAQLVATTYDEVWFRVEAAELVRGFMPLEVANELVQGAREVIEAAARAERRPRATFTGDAPVDVQNLLSTAEMGPVREGSVILNVRQRTQVSVPRQTSLVPDNVVPLHDEPFGRRAFAKVLSAGLAARRVTEQTISPDIDLSDDVAAGLSIEYCTGLMHLAGAGTRLGASVTLGASWSTHRPLSSRLEPVRIEASNVARLGSVVEALRREETIPDQAVLASVRDVHVADDPSWVFLNAWIGHRERAVKTRVNLPLDQAYEWLAEHQAGRRIAFVGTAVRSRAGWAVEDVRNVRFLEPSAADGDRRSEAP